MIKMPPAMILCGGRGTRLQERSNVLPKPMIEIGERPILWHIMKIFASYGVQEFILCVGYKSEVIVDYFVNYQTRSHDLHIDLGTGRVEMAEDRGPQDDWRVTIAQTGLEANTGARVARAARHIGQDRFFLTYGDGVADVDIHDLLATHIQSGKRATLTGVHPSSRFGELKAENGTVTHFREKPQTTDGWVNGGFMVIETEALEHMPHSAQASVEDDFLVPLSTRGELGLFHHTGYWQCMDTQREVDTLNAQWAAGSPPWKVW